MGGQTGDDEVILIFKVFEYAFVEKFSIRAWIGENDETKMVPIRTSRQSSTDKERSPRRNEGIALIRRRIQEATEK